MSLANTWSSKTRSPGTTRLLEISDLIVDFDLQTLERLPVSKKDVVGQLQDAGDHAAAKIVSQMPATNGILDSEFVDQLLIRVHCEMQRLSEEFQHGQRVMELLKPMLKALHDSGVRPPYRVVDIGCGTGYVVRWLTARARFDDPVELLGVDFNRGLIREANRLSKMENLDCHFDVANAFALEQPATLFLSTGVVHHFRDAALDYFFEQHDRPETLGFAHFDFQPTIFAKPGAWLFHYVRMREPLARHDGVVSACRAHSAKTLLKSARRTTFHCGMYSARIWRTPLPRVFHTVLGIREPLIDSFRKSLGPRVARLEPLS